MSSSLLPCENLLILRTCDMTAKRSSPLTKWPYLHLRFTFWLMISHKKWNCKNRAIRESQRNSKEPISQLVSWILINSSTNQFLTSRGSRSQFGGSRHFLTSSILKLECFNCDFAHYSRYRCIQIAMVAFHHHVVRADAAHYEACWSRYILLSLQIPI